MVLLGCFPEQMATSKFLENGCEFKRNGSLYLQALPFPPFADSFLNSGGYLFSPTITNGRSSVSSFGFPIFH
jgi:hypothetical protein